METDACLPLEVNVMTMAPSPERIHQIGSAVAWVGMWTGAGLILRGHPDAFYLIGSAIVWTALLAGTALLLGGTPPLGPMLGLLAAGAVYFLAVAPVYMIIMWPPGT